MPVRIEKLEGKAFLAFPEMQNLLLSEIETRFCTDLKPEKTYGELLYFSQWNFCLQKDRHLGQFFHYFL